MAVELGIVKKSGAWFTYEGEQMGQGRENAKTFLAENLEVMVEIDAQVRKATGLVDDGDTADTLGADVPLEPDADGPASRPGRGKAKVVDIPGAAGSDSGAAGDADDEPITLE